MYSSEVSAYTANRKESFKPSEEVDKWIDKKYNEKRFDNIMNGFYVAGGGALGLWLLAYGIGWIMRGFMGIPRGMDKRPSTDSAP